ncbi:MAG: helix-turn-helix domain-containing protein [Mycobacteriales bacterium]
MDAVNSRRAYRSPVREASARATREAVLAAAEELFVAQGFALTSVDQIATQAGVSRPTVFSLGTKTALLAQLRDRALAGDDEPVPVRERAWFVALLADPEPAGVLGRYADGVAQIAKRYAQLEEVLHQTAGAHRDLRDLWQANETQRHAGVTVVVDDLLGKGPLRHDRDTSRDLLWLLASSQHYRRLVHGRRWSHQRYRQWLGTTMCEQLLPAAHP